MATCGHAKISKIGAFMSKAKRILLFLAAIALAICISAALFACDDGQNDNSVPPESDPEQSAPPEEEEPPDGDQLKTFDDVIFEDESVVYDGYAHTIQPKNLPFGATVKYSITNCVDVGEYQLIATFKLVGYQTATKSATLTILPATVDVRFDGAVFTWDGLPHSIYVSGDLPSDALVTYTGNGCVEVGEYTVCAHIVLNKNYNPVDDLFATLTIIERTYVVTFVHWDGTTEQFSVRRGGSIMWYEAPANKQKDGYYQMIWDPAEIARLQDIRSDMTVHEVEGAAKIYTVEFDPRGGVISGSAYEETVDGRYLFYYTVEDNVILPKPFKFDDEFLGWYDEEGRLVTRLPDDAGLRDMKLYAHWRSDNDAPSSTPSPSIP